MKGFLTSAVACVRLAMHCLLDAVYLQKGVILLRKALQILSVMQNNRQECQDELSCCLDLT